MLGSIILSAAIIAGAADSPSATSEADEQLRLVHADEFSIVFMPEQHAFPRMQASPVDVRTVTIFETPALLGQVSEWDVRISETRIDCQAGLIGDRAHRIFLGETPVDETTPPFRMQRPNGPEKAAILAYACHPTPASADILVDDIPAARAWAADAYLRIRASQR
ncbi:hypothetical protein ACO2Q1_12840 [Brevundimonas sp. VNH65]|uniref:hypothetical protein n=1 Tax=Brevundimonas sp. VNH65 TaxID=3400917 RepID=UPI003C06C11E